MKIGELQKITEMGKPVKLCPRCGKSTAANHYYYKPRGAEKGEWRCKGGAGGSPSAPKPSILQDLTAKQEEPPTVAEPMQQATNVAPQPTPAAPPQLRNSNEEMEKWLANHKITDYEVNPQTGGLIVKQEVQLDGLRMKALPVKFESVAEDCMIVGGMLESLVGSPQTVGGDFMVNHNKIKSLVGAPRHVEETCAFSGNPFSSLEGLPEHIGQTLWLDTCENLTSLQNIHKYCKFIGEEINATDKTMLKSNILGVLLIKGLKRIKLDSSLSKVQEIVNKHLEGDRDFVACQDELIDAGFEPFARL